MDYSEQAPLGQNFYSNPYQYLQNYIRNMNNEIFLSEYQINNLYALLLIGRGCPWDGLRTTTPNYKQQVDLLVQKKIKDVKFLLDNMSQLYEDKVKKSAFNQIQRLMSILKAKNKSIYIQKNMTNGHHCQHPENQQSSQHQSKHQHSHQCSHQNNQNQNREGNKGKMQHNNIIQQQPMRKPSKQYETKQQKQKSIREGELQVLGLISHLGNIPNLSALALGNCIEYNSTQRFIKFKMTKNYIMTIKNDDPVSYDLTSRFAKVPSSMFVSHIFPYLTAWELFRARSVCKEWYGYVKDSWHSTFKRQMYIQLLAGQFCKDIEFFYKCIQLRNPFFQKLSLLLHALIQIIQWQQITQAIDQNRINAPFKRVLIVLLKLIGENININNFNDLTEQLWQIHKHKIVTLKQKVVQFFSNFNGNSMTINQLRNLKINILDHPFMRGDQMQTQQKTPILLLIFIKQLNLQQILKNHLHFSQQYMLNSKNRLDALSAKMPHQRGFLEGVYKILLLKTSNQKQDQQIQDDARQMPSFHDMIQTIFDNKESDKPDFFIKTKNSRTNIYMDRATKLEIIISTVKKSYGKEFNLQQMKQNEKNVQKNQQNKNQLINYQEIQNKEKINSDMNNVSKQNGQYKNIQNINYSFDKQSIHQNSNLQNQSNQINIGTAYTENKNEQKKDQTKSNEK